MANDGDNRETLRTEIVDYLYGGLDEGRRRAFEAALAEDAELRREVGALEGTLGRAREALRAGDEAQSPPARVRAAALSAARARIAATRPATEVPRPDVRKRDEATLWQRLGAWWKRPWVIPAMLATAAIALFVLGRETIVGESTRGLWKAPVPVSAPAPAPAEGKPAADEAAPALAAQPDEDRSESKKEKGGRGAAGERSRARAADEDAVGGLRASPTPEPRAAAPARRKAAPAPGATRGGSAADRAFARPPADWQAEPAAEAEEGAVANEPPPPAKPSAAKRARADDDELSTSEAVRDRASVGQAAPAAPATSGAGQAPAAAAPPPPAVAPQGAGGRATSEAAESKSSVSAAPLPRDALVTRAREAAEAGRWSEAARLYRTLLARYPKDRDAARWRERLVESERALRAE